MDNTQRSTGGLYGSSGSGTNMLLTCVAEALGTMILVLVGTAAAVAATLELPIAGGGYDSFAIALAFGIALVAIISTIGHVSGGHVNPVVTVALAVTRNFPWRYVPGYVAAQLAGAIAASLLVWGMFGDAARDRAALGATLPVDGVGTMQALLAEAVVTFILVFTIMAVATDDRVPPASAALSIGLVLAAAIVVAGPLTGGAVNPARALGPMIASATFDGWWHYVVGPLVGGITAGVVYQYVIGKATQPQT